MTKVCNLCSVEKDISEFHKHKSSKGGHRNCCRECRKPLIKAYRLTREAKYREKDNAYRITWNKKHRTEARSRYQSCKDSSKRRKIVFTLSLEEFKSFEDKPCRYCNDPIKQISLDRVDNNLGYFLDNVVPCCPKCNYMKLQMDVPDFADHILKLCKHLDSWSKL